jgi:small subunit ribosomal protein S4e
VENQILRKIKSRRKNKMAHLKRNKIGKFWPVPRKGTKYLAVSMHNKNESIPLVVVMRDVLKLIKNKKELKKIINEKGIMINHKEIRETNYPVSLFDVINLPKIKKNYKAILSKNKKMNFEEVSEEESKTKVFKVISKKLLRKNKVQLNLMHGKNIISDEKVNTGDSVVLNLEDNKIIRVIPMKEGQDVFVVKGKHAGHQGKIQEIMDRGGKSIAKIISDEGKVNVWIKNIIVVK